MDCCWYLVYVDRPQIMMRRAAASQKKGTTMSKTAFVGFAPSNSLFGRLMANIDRVLMIWARAAVRNGDQPHIGL